MEQEFKDLQFQNQLLQFRKDLNQRKMDKISHDMQNEDEGIPVGHPGPPENLCNDLSATIYALADEYTTNNCQPPITIT